MKIHEKKPKLLAEIAIMALGKEGKKNEQIRFIEYESNTNTK